MGSSSGGGSRSSFSSGGSKSSFGSSSSSSSHSSRSYRSSWGGRYSHSHTSVHVYGGFHSSSSKLISIILTCVFAFIGIVFIVVGSTQIANTNKLLSIKKADYTYYQNMISYAEQNPEYMQTGYVIDVYFDNEVNSHYFDYSVCGYRFSTFACYDTVSAPAPGQQINVALNCPKQMFGSFSDSMPVSYKYTALVDDGEYRSIRGDRTVGIFFVVFGSIFIVVAIITIVKSRKKSTETVEEPIAEAPPQPKPSKKFCAYCGAENSPESRKCSSCGARIE